MQQSEILRVFGYEGSLWALWFCLSAEQNFKFRVFVISVLLWWASCDRPVISIRKKKRKKKKRKRKRKKARKESPLTGFEPRFLITKELLMCYNGLDDIFPYIFILLCLLNKTNYYS